MVPPLSDTKIKNDLRKVHGDKLKLLNLVVDNQRKKLQVQCTTCNRIWITPYYACIAAGKGCKVCGDNKRKLTKETLQEVLPDNIICLKFTTFDGYKKYKCNKCNYKWQALGNYPVNCKGCYLKEKANKQINNFYKEFKKIHGNKFKFIVGYTTALNKIKVLCTDCKSTLHVNARSLKIRGCKVCNYEKHHYQCKEFKIKGKIFRVQGYEKLAIEYLIQRGFKPANIITKVYEGKPSFDYIFKGKRKYIPDFYVKSNNTVYEVKSPYTLGVKDKNLYNKNRKKALSVVKAGYRYRVILFTAKHKFIRLPEEWYNMDYMATSAFIAACAT